MPASEAKVAWCIVGAAFMIVLIFINLSLVLQCCADSCYDLTQTLFPALDDAGYEYWMDWGTLLGARREGTIIDHDYDADIGMREDEFQRLRKDWKTRFSPMKLRLSGESNGLWRIRKGFGWIDIFRYKENSDGSLSMLSMPENKHGCKCRKGHKVRLTDVLPLRRLRFGAVTAPAPAQTENYLEHCYGKTWRTPLQKGLSKMVYWRLK